MRSPLFDFRFPNGQDGPSAQLPGYRNFRARVRLTLLLVFGVWLYRVTFAGAPVLGGALPLPLPLFPPTNWWNLDISSAPVDSNSSSFINFINNGTPRKLHPDFGGDVSPGSVEIYGFPYIVVDAAQPKKAVTFLYADESDGVDATTGRGIPFYPIPDEAITQRHWIEGGEPGNLDLRSEADRHMLIVDRDNRYLYELYNVFYDGAIWRAGSGAFFDLKTNTRRPDGWTSSDAAGLAILPGLVRYDEVFGPDDIRHAFRVTVRATNGYVYPASHRAGSNTQALPMGARLRLKAAFNISSFSSAIQKIFRAMKKYGLIVADNGSDMFISGTYDTRWNNDILNPAFGLLTANDFEVIKLGFNEAQTYFSQVAVGGGYTTTFNLLNTGSSSVVGTLFLTGQDGKPFTVTVSDPDRNTQRVAVNARDSSFSVLVPSGGLQILTAMALNSGDPTQSGWARVQTTGGSLGGVATFQQTEGAKLKTIAGVVASQPIPFATIPVDNDHSRDRFTGYALANPNNEEINVKVTTLDENGLVLENISPSVLNPLGSLKQVARFLHQDLTTRLKFKGLMVLEAQDGKNFVVVALVQNQNLLTAVPVTPAKPPILSAQPGSKSERGSPAR